MRKPVPLLFAGAIVLGVGVITANLVPSYEVIDGATAAKRAAATYATNTELKCRTFTVSPANPGMTISVEHADCTETAFWATLGRNMAENASSGDNLKIAKVTMHKDHYEALIIRETE